MAVKTPAARVRERRNPAILRPPDPPKGDRWSAVRGMRWMIAGAPYLVGPAVEGDPAMEASAADAAATLTVQVRDRRGKLMQALGDEATLLESGVSTTVNGVVYMLREANDPDGSGLVTATFEDAVKWRMSRHTRHVSMRRTEVQTIFRFAERLVMEAQVPPLAPFGFFCPQLYDRLDIPKARRQKERAKAGEPGRKRGVGASSAYTVKGQPADKTQLDTIDDVLDEGASEGAGRRVLVAAIMAITQESVAGKLIVSSSGQHHGAFHQDASYGSVGERRQPRYAMKGFLRVWKDRNGSIKTVRGSLADAIDRVQVSGNPSGYAQWQSEAEKTVAEWEGAGGSAGGGSVSVEEPDSFTRGEKGGQRETSWDAIGRYAQPRNIRRFAFGNTLYLVSDDELNAAAPSLEINGDEGWLRSRPGWSWAPQRPITELPLTVLAERWGIMPGAVVRMALDDPRDGRWIVGGWSGAMVNPELAVTLRRPQERAPEPARGLTSVSIGGTVSAVSGNVIDVARAISAKHYPYVWGGGHAHAGTPDRGDGSDPGIGFDCSGATGAFLAALGHGFKPGDSVPGSGTFASSWGVGGPGQVYSVWANATHVFVEFADGSRFDTSQHSENGVRYVKDKRSTAGFTPRHWRNL
jgi:hypothetical protein